MTVKPPSLLRVFTTVERRTSPRFEEWVRSDLFLDTVAIANALSEGKLDVMPEVLVTGGGGALEGLAATFMRSLNGNGEAKAKK